MLRLALVLLLAVAVGIANAQCAAGRYGADCSCTSANVNEYALTRGGVCNGGTWDFPGPLSTNPTDEVFDISTDTVRVSNFSIGSSNTQYRFTIRINNNGTVVGTLIANTTVSFNNCTIGMFFDDIGVNRYVIQPIFFGSAPSITSRFQPLFSRRVQPCRTIDTNNFTTPWRNGALTISFTMADRGSPCFDGLLERSWVVTAMIVIGVACAVIIIFAIITCCVRPAKRAIWYPPSS